MYKVALISYPEDFDARQSELERLLNSIDHNGGTILHITSDTEGYTIVFKEVETRPLHG